MSNPASSLGIRMYSLLDRWGLELRTRPGYLLHHTFSSWLGVMVLLDSQVQVGLRLMLLPVSVGESLVGWSYIISSSRRSGCDSLRAIHD